MGIVSLELLSGVWSSHAPSSFLLLVVRPGAPRSVLAPSSDALVPSSFLLLLVRMLLVAMPGAPSSVLAPSSKARSP